MSLLKRVTGVSYWRIAKNWFIIKTATIMAPGPFKNWFLRRTGATIHRSVFLSPDVLLDPVHPEDITIEDDVFIGFGVKLMSHLVQPGLKMSHGPILIERGAFIGGYTTIRRNTIIMEGAVIGSDCLIRERVVIGRDALVYDFSLVTKDVPSGSRVAGIPADVLPNNTARNETMPVS